MWVVGAGRVGRRLCRPVRHMITGASASTAASLVVLLAGVGRLSAVSDRPTWWLLSSLLVLYILVRRIASAARD